MGATCVQCGGAVPGNSRFCPSCGTQLLAVADGEQKPVQKSASGWVVAGVALLVVGLCTNWFGLGSSGDDGDSLDDRRRFAFFACEDFVKDRLKAPSTADFPNAFSDDVNITGVNPFTVRSHVDAENGFGAKLRMGFTCTVHEDGEDIVLDNLTLDE